MPDNETSVRLVAVPAELWTPPDSAATELPVVTKLQCLPLHSLTWENFEKLCLRIASVDGDCEHCQLYGTRGQAQSGIDFYVRRRTNDKYCVTQCKRYASFSTSDLIAAVDVFLAGSWVQQSDTFRVAVSAATDRVAVAGEIETQAQRLRATGISLQVIGEAELSKTLKNHPELVEDFFGEAWCKEFCGDREIRRRKTITSVELPRLRRQLRELYRRHFEDIDPGLPLVAAAFARGSPSMSLESRYVVPDVLEQQRIVSWVASQTRSSDATAQEQQTSRVPEPGAVRTETVRVRRSLFAWAAESERAVIIGDPGSGKSTFLRYTALELLSDAPSEVTLLRAWGSRVPVWIPFALWTRLVADQPSACGLRDCVECWLRTMGATNDLMAMVLRALDDDRLLLLVDGLDEWSNETAARTAVNVLHTFVLARGIPALVTARPLGYQRLGGLGLEWRMGELGALTTAQQVSLVRRWFSHQDAVNLAANPPQSAVNLSQAIQRAESFVEELRRVAGLDRLASSPLLLCGLIALRLRNLRLPSNRFLAFRELTQLLIELHPQRRLKAALATTNPWPLTNSNRERLLAALAFEIHQAPGSFTLSRNQAQISVQRFLEQSLHKSAEQAYEQAETMLAVGADGLGLLVEKARDEIGFVHRVFQEHLAARHLARMPFESQCVWVRSLADQTPWRDVLLNLCYLNERENEVDSLLNILEAAPCRPHMSHERSLLLASVAFNDLHCSPARAHRIAIEIFSEIELGTWMPARARLLDSVLDGMESDVVGGAVRTKLAQWFPNRSRWPRGLAESLAVWPKDELTVEALFRLLNSEDAGVSREAALSLSKVFGNDQRIGLRIVRVAQSPADAHVTAAALLALGRGWPDIAETKTLLAEAIESDASLVRLAGLCGRVALGCRDDSIRDGLLDYCWDRGRAEYSWRPEIISSLLLGWPAHESYKRDALVAIQQPFRDGRYMESGFAAELLFRAFPQDDDVASVIADCFETEEYPYFRFDQLWSELAVNFSGHKRLVPAVDHWLSKTKQFQGPELYYAARIARSAIAKTQLLDFLEKGSLGLGWVVEALIEIWGPNDTIVEAALAKAIEDPSRRAWFAGALPKIVRDRARCRAILLEIIESGPSWGPGPAIASLSAIGVDATDKEAVEAALRSGDTDADGILACRHVVIGAFPSEPRVRDLARREIRRRQGEIGVVAATYGNDSTMRQDVIAFGLPLSTPLRRRIIERFAGIAGEDSFALAQLSDFDAESDDDLKSATSIAFHEALMQRRMDLGPATAALTGLLDVRGPDNEERRRAALAGLIALNRLDIIDAKKLGDGKVESWRITDSFDKNRTLSRYIGRRWKGVYAILGDSIWERFSDSRGALFETLSTEAIEPELVDRLVEMSKHRKKGESYPIAGLRLLARVRSKTEFLRDFCFDLVTRTNGNWFDFTEAFAAAEVLAEQFGEDAELGRKLEVHIKSGRARSAAIAALSLGWPKNEFLRDPTIAQNLDGRPLALPARLHLVACNASAVDYLQSASKLLGQLNGDIWDFLPACVLALRKRFSTDEQVCELALRRLGAGPSAAGKITLPRLIALAPKHSGELRIWCVEELANQLSGKHLPESALDIFTGVQRPVAHALLEFLQSLPE